MLGKCDTDVLLAFTEDTKRKNNKLPKHKGRITFEMDLQMDYRKKDASHAMVKRAIENGHTDAAIWVNLRNRRYNPFKKREDILEDSNSSWMMDLDDIDKSFGKQYNSPEMLVKLFQERGVLVPSHIIQTGKYNFHVVYYGHPKFWTKTRIDLVVFKFAGIIKKPSNNQDLDKRLSASGIDPARYRVDPKYHQVRVPGSLKSKIDEGEFFICTMWTNSHYNSDNPFSPFLTDYRQKKFHLYDVEEHQTITESNKQTAKQIYDKTYEVALREVKSVIGRGKASKKISELIANNIGLLKSGNLAIHQEGLAEKWGISQPTISRLLKALRKEDILKRTSRHVFVSNFHHANKATEYTIGSRLSEAIGLNPDNKGGLDEDIKQNLIRVLTSEYERGSTNQAFLKDLRIAYSIGVKKEDFVELSVHKFKHVRYPSRLKRSHIENAWDSWCDRFDVNYRKFSESNINIAPIIRQFE